MPTFPDSVASTIASSLFMASSKRMFFGSLIMLLRAILRIGAVPVKFARLSYARLDARQMPIEKARRHGRVQFRVNHHRLVVLGAARDPQVLGLRRQCIQ